MEKEFCTYEQSLALKDLGFDEEFYFGWNKDNEIAVILPHHSKKMIDCGILPTPLIQQAFRFFREKYGLYGSVIRGMSLFEPYIEDEAGLEESYKASYHSTYEEAEQACLDKLIELARSVSGSEQTREK